MKHAIVAALAASLLLGLSANADAKTWRSNNSTHSSSRSSGAGRTRVAKPKPDLIIVKCKTKGCLKKHPSGVYAFKPKPKKS